MESLNGKLKLPAHPAESGQFEEMAFDHGKGENLHSSDGLQMPIKMKKEHRQRMKGLLSDIKRQMEFYLGDANINKDRFMKEQLEKSSDGYIPISLFMKFNKIKNLTDDMDIIIKALQSSQLLEVNKERTKLRRIQPVHIMSPEEIDERTVYVEGLHSSADHEWIEHYFSSCGKVTYISLPRYKCTGDIKGFAFIEFEKTEEALKAVKLLNTIEEEKITQSIKPLKNLKYWRKRAIREGIDPDREEIKSQTIETSEDNSAKKESAKDKGSKKHKKRKRQTSELSFEESGHPAKTEKSEISNSEELGQQTKKTRTESANSEESGQPAKKTKTESAKSEESGHPTKKSESENNEDLSQPAKKAKTESVNIEESVQSARKTKTESANNEDLSQPAKKAKTESVNSEESVQSAKKERNESAHTEENSTAIHKDYSHTEILYEKTKYTAIAKRSDADSSAFQRDLRSSKSESSACLMPDSLTQKDNIKRKRKFESPVTETQIKTPKLTGTSAVKKSFESPVTETQIKTSKPTGTSAVKKSFESPVTETQIKTPKPTGSSAVKKSFKREGEDRRDGGDKKEKDTQWGKNRSIVTVTNSKNLIQVELKENVKEREHNWKYLDEGDMTHAKETKTQLSMPTPSILTQSQRTKKKRRRKNKMRKETPKLRVITKKEWLCLKKEYLDQQRASMANLKHQLWTRKENVLPSKDLKSGAKSGAKAEYPVLALRNAPEFVPNVIVEIRSEEGMFHKQLKQRINPGINIAYIDVKDGMTNGYIRCKDAESAHKMIDLGLQGCSLTIVQGDAEKAYWNKMMQDREAKLCNSKQRKKKKGVTKLLEKVQNATLDSMKQNHILFGDDLGSR